MAEFDFSNVLRDVAQVIETRVLLQMPVKTGKLKRSLRAVVDNGQIYLVYDDYGVFTNYGTGPYYNGNYGQPAELDSYRGYVKGQGGIQAQNWSSIYSSDEAQIQQMLEDELARQTEAAIEEAFK
jgi:hypothetical protein